MITLNWSSFLSGHLRQILLYNQQSIYIICINKCLCQCVGKAYYEMSTVFSLICLGPSFQKMTHHFLLHGSPRLTNLEQNLKPCTHVRSSIYSYLWIPSSLVIIIFFISPLLSIIWGRNKIQHLYTVLKVVLYNTIQRFYEKNLFRPYAKNRDAAKSMHSHSLSSVMLFISKTTL